MTLKVVHKRGEDEPKQVKKLEMYEDPVFMANLKRKFFEDHNQKIAAAIVKGKKGLPLTKHERVIYNKHLGEQNNKSKN